MRVAVVALRLSLGLLSRGSATHRSSKQGGALVPLSFGQADESVDVRRGVVELDLLSRR